MAGELGLGQVQRLAAGFQPVAKGHPSFTMFFGQDEQDVQDIFGAILYILFILSKKIAG
ncbi:MAG: hypothetical protein ABIQ99_11750 [Thermoflexales bacterium]